MLIVLKMLTPRNIIYFSIIYYVYKYLVLSNYALNFKHVVYKL